MSQDKNTLSRRKLLFGAFRRKAEDWEPEAPVSSSDESEAVLKEANRAYSSGELAEAARGYREYLKLEPQDAEARQRLAWCFYNMGKLVQAKVEFERIIRQKEGKDNFSFLYLGLTLCRMGKPDKAAVVWKRYFNPQNIDVQRELNVQTALIESGDEPEPMGVVREVEAAIQASRKRRESGA